MRRTIYSIISAIATISLLLVPEAISAPSNVAHDAWKLIIDDAVATVYNAVPEQCNNDVRHTASMFVLNLDDVVSNHVIAMERTMMAEYGISYGDVVIVVGAGDYDGLWRVEDTMNRRFAGQHRIDFLVPNDIKLGKWKNVRIYVPANSVTKENSLKKLLEI